MNTVHIILIDIVQSLHSIAHLIVCSITVRATPISYWTAINCVGGRLIINFMLTYNLLFQNNYNYAGIATVLGARLDKNNTPISDLHKNVKI